MIQVREFKPIKTTRISDEVLAQIKDAILTGRFKPGEKLPSERELIESFNVSRAVIREAVRSLELTGFVTVRQGPTGGAFVNDLNLDRVSSAYLDLFNAGKFSMEELTQVRLHLEPEIVRLATANITPAKLADLETVYKKEHNPTKHHSAWVRQNLEIHHALAAICGNRFYEALINPVLTLTEELICVVKPSQMVIHSHPEHAKVIRLVGLGQADKAAKAMAEHVKNTTSALGDLERDYRMRMGLPLPDKLKH
ncbi:FadR/GntR family transcriptional regulator [Dethiosulfatarculus sandiegensis]|uniref:GntR family transcriptional regulator n=1 Tax=Dethiosulfatarculus sandiegensis TaxID=1429043 RepID=A0A0D2HMA6_9BACT|nr:FadR/GntR family transcriptional regulator [Dethiosulfatarculus sandiegensis]KIX11743.1 GntR family transcriptional regulator [Dethiosulfatarculus sandiegensis]